MPRVEEVIVTAQKREQNLQDVPISITALSADALVANRVQDVRDLSALTPNLTVRLGAGGDQAPVYTMRGLLTGGTAAGTDKGVGLYLDGVYIQNVSGSVFEFADIERIEVLKGPQGTLFGRNSTGGAISILTKDPTGEFGGYQEIGLGNFDTRRSKTHIDLGKVGPVSAAVTYLHSERDGDIRNLGAGTTWDYGPATNGKLGKRTSPDDLGASDTDAVLAALKFDLIEDLHLVYKFDYSKSDFTPGGQGVAYLPEGFLRNLYETSPNPMTPVTKHRPEVVNNAFTTPGETENYGHNLTAEYQLNDAISLKNIFAHRTTTMITTFQLDGLGGLVNALEVAPGFFIPPSSFNANPGLGVAPLDAPFAFLANNGQNEERQWSDEFQLNVSTDLLNLTAGYLHFHDRALTNGLDDLINLSVLTAFSGQQTTANGTAYVIPGNPGYRHAEVTVNSDALFTQAEFHVNDQIDLIGGVRVTHDEKDGTETLPDTTLAAANGLPLSTPIKYSDTEWTYLAGVNYRPMDHILTYAKYSTGYISGGQLATITFAPELAKSWEVGIKADLFDRRFRTNLAVFDVNYQKIQYTTAGYLAGVASAAAFSQAVIPSADGRAKGFEWENTLIPLHGVTLQAGIGYTDFKFDQSSVFPGFALASGAPGYQEFQRPDWTANLSAQYDTPGLYNGGHLSFRIDGAFRSKALLTPDLTSVEGATAPEDPAIRDSATSPAHWLVNARIALADVQVGSCTAFIAVWGRNIFDNDNIVQYNNFGPVASVIYERARTFGVDLGVGF